MNKVERLLREVRTRLGLSRFLGRRALRELRDHLDDSVADQLSRGIGRDEAETDATLQIGTPDELMRSVIDTSRGLKMIAFVNRNLLATVAFLAAPGALLLGLSFLTFNFPCRDLTYGSAGDMTTYRVCGASALENVRPLISEVGFYGGPAWAQWTIHVLSVMGPLVASMLIVRSQLSLRRRTTPEETTEVAFALDRTHILALLATLSIFVTVVTYKAAG
jgi:hypothetical protein